MNVLRDAKLAEVTFEGVLPPHTIPGVRTGAQAPADYIGRWQALMESKEPVGFVYAGDGWSIAMSASIEGLDYREKGGAVGWLEYTMTVLKWVPYAAKRVIMPQSTGVAAGQPRTESVPSAVRVEESGASSFKSKSTAQSASSMKKPDLTIGGDRAKRAIMEGIGAAGYSMPMNIT